MTQDNYSIDAVDCDGKKFTILKDNENLIDSYYDVMGFEKEEAQHIVKCVNSHPALVEDLEMIKKSEEIALFNGNHSKTWKIADKALSIAKGDDND